MVTTDFTGDKLEVFGGGETDLYAGNDTDLVMVAGLLCDPELKMVFFREL